MSQTDQTTTDSDRAVARIENELAIVDEDPTQHQPSFAGDIRIVLERLRTAEQQLLDVTGEQEEWHRSLQGEITDHGDTARQLEEMTNWRTHTQNEVDALQERYALLWPLKEELEAKLAAAEAERDKAIKERDMRLGMIGLLEDELRSTRESWMSHQHQEDDRKLAELEEQIRSLTAEISVHEESWKVHEVCHLETAQLREQVRSLTAERDEARTPIVELEPLEPDTIWLRQLIKLSGGHSFFITHFMKQHLNGLIQQHEQLREQVERLTEQLEAKNVS